MKLQDEVRERDMHRCILCDRPAGEVHHVIPRGRARAWPEVNSLYNLVTLCRGCHEKVANQDGRLECLNYLIGLYGIDFYLAREPWAQVLRRADVIG